MKKITAMLAGIIVSAALAEEPSFTTGPWRLTDGCTRQNGEIVISSPSSETSPSGHQAVDLKSWGGRTLRLVAEIKAQQVSRPREEYNGVKFGIRLPGRKPEYYNAAGLWGSFDWEKTEVVVPLPPQVTTGDVFIGLQGSSGTASFRNIHLEILPDGHNLENQEALKTAGEPIVLSRGGWTFAPEVRLLNGGQQAVLMAEVTGSGQGQFYASRPFDFLPYQGKTVYIDYECQAENVSQPAEKWFGIKVMFTYETDGGKKYIDCGTNGLCGTFPWRKFTSSFIVPSGAKNGRLYLGLQNASGRVQFRHLRIRTVDLNKMFPAPVKIPNGFRCVYTERVTREPVLRGVMSPIKFNAADFAELKKWNVNLIRWQLQNFNQVPDYRKWLEEKLKEFDAVLAECAKYRIRVILDLHLLPGGRYPNRDCRLLYEKTFRDEFLAVWEEIARRYRGNPNIYAYDLINEPQQTEPTPDTYLDVQYRAALMIRRIDPDVPLIVEANMSSTPESYQYMHPLPLKDIIYQVHSYYPGAYTHQGVFTKGKYLSVVYPNPQLNIETLRHNLKYPRAFQLKYGARIYVGEFSAIRWAPGAERYIDDAIRLFEEYGWDWTFHAFREWDGWSVEHSEERNNHVPVQSDTARKKVLLKYFRLNQY